MMSRTRLPFAQVIAGLVTAVLPLANASDALGEDAPSCEDTCRERAIAYYELCVEAGDDDAECMARAEAVYGACVENCANDEDDTSDEGANSGAQQEEEPCVAQCRQKAKVAFEKCIASGEADGVCHARSERVFAVCRNNCE